LGGQRVTEHIMAYREPTIGRTLRRSELYASGHAYGCASILSIGRLRSALRAFVTGAWLPPRCTPRVRQHVSCVAVQRDAILRTLAILRIFAAYPQRGRHA